MGLFDGKKFDLQSAVGKIQEKIVDVSQSVEVSNSSISNMQHEKMDEFSFCPNCGIRLNKGAKFCHGCGISVKMFLDEEKDNQQGIPPIPQNDVDCNVTTQNSNSKRQQEYVGKILKCPNCGAHITETTAICPDCGEKITGKAAVSSIQTFKEQLMAIENSRRSSLGDMFKKVNKSDMQKLTLIRNFPIPNSIDDCLEFMMLAIANIDVSLSKNTLVNRINDSGKVETADTIGRTISNAWVSKMEQVYRKAEIVFPNDPAFANVQRMYFEKMKELKIKVK